MTLARRQLSGEARHIILRLVVHAARPGDSECILVFLPGINEIADLQDELDHMDSRVTPLQV